MKYFRERRRKSSDKSAAEVDRPEPSSVARAERSKVGRSEPSDAARCEPTCIGRSDRRNDQLRLMQELAYKDEEVAGQRQEIGRLHTAVAKIAEQQAAQKKHMQSLEQEHKLELRNLQKRIEEERAEKHAIETELSTLMDRCNELVHESKLNEMEEAENHGEADHASYYREGPSTYGSSEGARSTYNSNYGGQSSSGGNSSEAHASMSKHIKQLKGHMSNLEASLDHDLPYLDDEELERKKESELEASTSRACAYVQKDLGRLKRWAAWKWRWAAEALRSDIMSKRLEDVENSALGNSPCRRSKCPRCNKRTCGCAAPQDGLVPAVMSAWRAYARAIRLEKKSLSMIASLEKMVSALPWWIRRVGQRRLLERCFFRWQLQALRHNKVSVPTQEVNDSSMDGLTRKCSACKHDIECKASKKVHSDTRKANATTTKPRKAWGSCNGKKEYLAWENQVRQKRASSGLATKSSGKGLRALQASLQKELQELQSQLAGHLKVLQEDKPRALKGPIWKGSWNSTWEVCNNLSRSITEAHKQLGSIDGRVKEGQKNEPSRHKGVQEQEQMLDFPGGFQQKLNSQNASSGIVYPSKASPRKVSNTRSYSKGKQKPARLENTVVEAPPACNLTLEPGAMVNLSCGDALNSKDGKGGDRLGWDDQRGRICTAAQYAEYLREEIRRLKVWQAEHESEIKKELGGELGGQLTGDVHPELEIQF